MLEKMSVCENDDGVTALEYFLQSQEAQTQVIDYFDHFTVYGLFVYLWSDMSVCSVCCRLWADGLLKQPGCT